MEKIEGDFNLTDIIIDFKERQREKILKKMAENFRAQFIKHKIQKREEEAPALKMPPERQFENQEALSV